MRVRWFDWKCSENEAAINLRSGFFTRFRDMDCVQKNLIPGGEGYAKQKNTGVRASQPDVALNRLMRCGLILALKEVSAFEGEDKRFLNFL